jgi:hypothetical protein
MTGPSPQGRVLAQAVALGMRADVAILDRGDVARLESMAAALPANCPARALVTRFMAAWSNARRDSRAVQEAAKAMVRDAMRVMRPGPVDAHRVDIHG